MVLLCKRHFCFCFLDRFVEWIKKWERCLRKENGIKREIRGWRLDIAWSGAIKQNIADTKVDCCQTVAISEVLHFVTKKIRIDLVVLVGSLMLSNSINNQY